MERAFWIKGKWADTNRIRQVYFKAKNEEQALSLALDKGLLNHTETIEDFSHLPTEPQISYASKLGIKITNEMEKEDVSVLIDRKVNGDNQDPQPGLIDFAKDMNVSFNIHIGKKELYNSVFRSLQNIDKISFFLFCVYRFISDDRHANLNTHPDKDIFYRFADRKANDEKFLSSLNGYSGEGIRFFGTLKIENQEYLGGSTKTYAFQESRNFLISQTLINKNDNYTSKKILPKKKSSINSSYQKTPHKNVKNEPTTYKKTLYGIIVLAIMASTFAILRFFVN